MTKPELLHKLKEALQREEPLAEETQIKDIKEWDSLAALSIISLFDEYFSVTIEPRKLTKTTSMKELIDLVGDKLEQK